MASNSPRTPTGGSEPVTPSRKALLDNTKWSAERVFNLFDEDKGGTLDTEELAAALTATVGKRFDKTKAQPYMEKYDADKSGELDKDEFKRLVDEVRADLAKAKKEGASRGPPHPPNPANTHFTLLSRLCFNGCYE